MPLVQVTQDPLIATERCDRLCDAVVEAAETTDIGVYLSLPVAAWAQGE